jgi:hypothetical protein
MFIGCPKALSIMIPQDPRLALEQSVPNFSCTESLESYREDFLLRVSAGIDISSYPLKTTSVGSVLPSAMHEFWSKLLLNNSVLKRS